MAMRMTETKKWDKDWFLDLTPRMKAAWEYLCDKCDHAGIWIEAYRKMTGEVNCPDEPFSREELLNTFGHRIRVVDDDKLLIPGFMPFQYGKLNPKVAVQKTAIKLLEALGIDVATLPWKKNKATLTEGLAKGYGRVSQGLANPASSSVFDPSPQTQGLAKGYLTLKDKDKEILLEGGVGETNSSDFVDNSAAPHEDGIPWTPPEEAIAQFEAAGDHASAELIRGRLRKEIPKLTSPPAGLEDQIARLEAAGETVLANDLRQQTQGGKGAIA